MRRLYLRYRELRSRRRVVRFAEDALLILVAVGLVLAWQTRNLVPSGEPAPPFELLDLQGKTWRSEDLRGKPVVLHLWAPWCGVCKTETGTLSRLHDAVGEDAHVLSIALSYRTAAEVRRFAERHGARYPVLLGDDALMEALRVEAFPTTYFLSPEGRITGSAVGITTTVGLRYRLWRSR